MVVLFPGLPVNYSKRSTGFDVAEFSEEQGGDIYNNITHDTMSAFYIWVTDLSEVDLYIGLQRCFHTATESRWVVVEHTS